MLQDAAEQRQQRFTRPDAILERVKPTEEPELDLDEVSIWTLLEAFDEILKATGQYQSYEHIKDDTPIDLYQIELLHRLQTEGPMTLQKAFEGRGNRLVMIGLFLGMLELMRNHLIWVEQPEINGPIYLKPLTHEPAEEAVHNAIYSNPEAMETASEHQPSEQPQEIEEPVDTLDERPVESIEGGDEEIDQDDEFFKELSSIDISDEPEKPSKPRIPIMELPSKPQSMPEKTPAEPVEESYP
jgi:hypothetical protein